MILGFCIKYPDVRSEAEAIISRLPGSIVQPHRPDAESAEPGPNNLPCQASAPPQQANEQPLIPATRDTKERKQMYSSSSSSSDSDEVPLVQVPRKRPSSRALINKRPKIAGIHAQHPKIKPDPDLNTSESSSPEPRVLSNLPDRSQAFSKRPQLKRKPKPRKAKRGEVVLEQPLSELTKDLTCIPIADIEV